MTNFQIVSTFAVAAASTNLPVPLDNPLHDINPLSTAGGAIVGVIGIIFCVETAAVVTSTMVDV